MNLHRIILPDKFRLNILIVINTLDVTCDFFELPSIFGKHLRIRILIQQYRQISYLLNAFLSNLDLRQNCLIGILRHLFLRILPVSVQLHDLLMLILPLQVFRKSLRRV